MGPHISAELRLRKRLIPRYHIFLTRIYRISEQIKLNLQKDHEERLVSAAALSVPISDVPPGRQYAPLLAQVT